MRISDWSSDVCSSDLQAFELEAELGRRGNADADRYRHRNAVDDIGLADVADYPACQQFGFRLFGYAGLQHDELVASEARYDVVGPNHVFETPRDRKSTRLNSSH